MYSDSLDVFSNAAVQAVSQNKPVEVINYPGVFVYPQKDPAILKEEKGKIIYSIQFFSVYISIIFNFYSYKILK